MQPVLARSPSPQPPWGGEHPWQDSVQVLARRLQTPPTHIQEHWPVQGAGVVVVVLVVVVLVLLVLEVEVLLVLDVLDVGAGPQGLRTSSQSAPWRGG